MHGRVLHPAHVTLLIQFGVTPLYIASREGHMEVVKVLLEHKADIDKADLVQ